MSDSSLPIRQLVTVTPESQDLWAHSREVAPRMDLAELCARQIETRVLSIPAVPYFS